MAPTCLFLLAVIVRYPELATIPPPTDETDELLWAFGILRDGALPLTASDPYLGPLASYLTAAAFALAGPSLAAGRAVSLALGALAAPAAWWLGRSLGGTAAGLVAGLATAVAFGPVVLGSHVAWSHGGAVAFTALALAGLVRVAQAEVPSRLLALGTGAAAGLALGAHPTVVALVPGPAAWWFWTVQRGSRLSGRDCLEHGGVSVSRPDGSAAGHRTWASVRPALWMAAGAAIAYAPILVLGAREGLAVFREAAAGREYVGIALTSWPAGVLAWLESLARNLVGPDVGGRAPENGAVISAGSLSVEAAAALGIGLVVAARRGVRLPLAVVVSGAALMPLMVTADKFTSLTGLRYAAPALPIAAAAVGVALGPRLAALWSARRAGLVIAGIAALITPLVYIGLFYTITRDRGVTGAPVLAVVEHLASSPASGGTFIDNSLDTKLVGGGEVGRAVGALLSLRDAPYERAPVDKIRWFLVNGDGATYNMVLSGDAATDLRREFALVPIREVAVVPGQVSRSGEFWGLFQYTSPAGSG